MFESYWEERAKRPAIWVERCSQTKSATGGSGSGDYHAYRRFKRNETVRLLQMQEEE